MANVNKVMLLGNLTRDPEVKYTPKGTAVAEIGMAINRIRKGDNGENIEEVTYVDVTLWGRTAELAGQYLARGRSVFIEGRLDLSQWTDKTTGEKRSKLRVVGENMQFIGGNSDGAKSGTSPQSQNRSTQDATRQASQSDQGWDESEEDDIPF